MGDKAANFDVDFLYMALIDKVGDFKVEVTPKIFYVDEKKLD